MENLNLKIRQLEDLIIAELNVSDVPIEAKRLILSDILNLTVKMADSAVKKEIEDNAESTSKCELAKPSVNEHAT